MTKRCKKIERFFSAVCKNEHFCTYQLLVELLMIRHKDHKAFSERLKQEESTLLKQRNI
jgi:hypothetical protein